MGTINTLPNVFTDVFAVESTPTPDTTISPPESVEEATSILLDSLQSLWEGFLRSLPLIAIGLVILVGGLLVARAVSNVTRRGVRRAGADQVVTNLAARLARLAVIVAAALLGLSVAGIPVGAALAGLGIAGLAIAFALQSILENFVAGILLIIRKPIRHGEQVRINDHEGTVDDIDLRVTRIVDYDGQQVVIPNAEVFRSTIVNLTRLGRRRTRLVVGIDYRDDHDRVGAVIEGALTDLPGVLATPAPQARCIEFASSSVDFEVRYWTAPDIGTVVDTRDRALRAVKSALDEAGMTIPWPITTVAVDDHTKAGSPG